ncbi:AhpC/TSA family protein [Hymenobacter sp. BT186]|uniref:AhpC/TSA family protein n=1 Tax=Hymenobacter telluris TaxID=2816474 RepID=A0A939EX76_9BACT|nr:AhpC/TSA family protein [Hymenobacter telluris]MBO0358832.1 AhpC/TSA family protein [Hymenobacter telluris]MBW3374858.1 AhpC/TSA family protein [Hymenobacter norwichensis]
MRTYLLGLLLLLGFSVSAQQATSFTLKGTIGKLNPPAKIFLLQDGIFHQSATLHNGAFELTGTVDNPMSTMVLLAHNGKLADAMRSPAIDRAFFFLGPEVAVFTSPDSLKNAREHRRLLDALQPINDKLEALEAQYPEAPELQPTEVTKRLDAQKKVLIQEQLRQLKTHIKANPGSPVSLYMLELIGGPIPQYAEVAPLYAALTPTIRNSPDGRVYNDRLQIIKAATRGTQLPNDPAVVAAVEKYDKAQSAILDKKREQLREAHRNELIAFVKANPSSYESLEALKEAAGPVPDYTEIMALYSTLAPSVKSTTEGKAYGEMLESLKDVSVGAKAPDFTQKTPDGRIVSLADYRGKYVLVDFWASWCGPCRAENPNMTKVYNEYKNRNFDILSVSLDDEKGRGKWLKAIQDDQLAWTQVSDLKGMDSEVAVRYHVRAIPQNFLIDPNGKIIATNLRGDALQAAVARHIK